MKKIVLLVAVIAFTASCNKKAGGNKGIIQEEHAPATVEQMHGNHDAHAEHPTKEATVVDSAAVTAAKVDSATTVN